MQYIKILRQKPLAVLWFSQLLSETGDQIYLVAALWIAVQVSPTAAAIVAASDFMSMFICSLFAGVYADRLNRRKAMIASDLIRALAVVTLPIAAYFGPISIIHLVFVGLTLGSLSALFAPCLIATIPAITHEAEALQATSGLMDATRRLARTIGPGLAGILAATISLSHFFTIDALSFLASAAGISYLNRSYKWPIKDHKLRSKNTAGVFHELKEAVAVARKNALISWDFATFIILNINYAIIYTVGLPVLAKNNFGGNIVAYSSIIATYGFASVIANIAAGNIHFKNTGLIKFTGDFIWGVGFLIIGLAPNLSIALIGAAISAVGSPMSNLTMSVAIQKYIPNQQVGKVYSLRITIAMAGAGIGLILAPFLFNHWNVSHVIAIASFGFILTGLVGIIRFARSIPDQ